MSKTLIEILIYISIYVAIGAAFFSAIFDTKWLSYLDKPSFKIVYGFYLGWLGFFSFKLSRRFIEHDIVSGLFPTEAIIFIIWGIAEHFEFIIRSAFFSSPSGAIVILISLFIPYYFGNIHNSIFGIWKEKRKS